VFGIPEWSAEHASRKPRHEGLRARVWIRQLAANHLRECRRIAHRELREALGAVAIGLPEYLPHFEIDAAVEACLVLVHREVERGAHVQAGQHAHGVVVLSVRDAHGSRAR
jgi:hypothetical protein